MNLEPWARLVRIPTVFTILADVSAAFLLVAHGPQPLGRMAAIVGAGVMFYWSGMIFNDLFDVEEDRRERPSRPLPSGAIAVSTARSAAILFMALGIVFAVLSGFIPAEGFATTWRPAGVAIALAIMILLYNGPLKSTPLAPMAMGTCRVLSFLLGASPVLLAGQDVPVYGFENHVLGAAIGFGVYIMGITLIARDEAKEIQRATVIGGLVVIFMGAMLLALSPRLAPPDAGFVMLGPQGVALLVGVLCISVLARGLVLLKDPRKERVQLVVRIGLLTLIPLAATFATLGAGAVCGLSIFALFVPAILLSLRVRMT